MKLTIPRDNLRRGLEAVSGAVPTRTTLPVLNHVKLEAEDGKLRLETTNLDTHLSFAVDAEVEEAGGLCIPAKRILEIAKVAPDAPIHLQTKDTTAKLKVGRTSYTLHGLEADEFPDPPKAPYGADHVIRAGDLWRLLDQVGFCASTEETRPIMNGVLWEITEGAMTMVATNGHRLAKYRVPIAVLAGAGGGGEPEARSEIIHPRSVQLGRALFDDEAEIEVAFSETHVVLRSGESRLLARTVEGPYPRYQQVVDSAADNNKELIVHRDSLVDAIRRVSVVLANEGSKVIRFTLGSEGLALSARTPDGGDADDFVAGEYTGDPLQIGFDSKYLLDMLPRVPSDTLRMSFKAPERAVSIHPVGEDAPDLVNIMSPFRLPD